MQEQTMPTTNRESARQENVTNVSKFNREKFIKNFRFSPELALGLHTDPEVPVEIKEKATDAEKLVAIIGFMSLSHKRAIPALYLQTKLGLQREDLRSLERTGWVEKRYVKNLKSGCIMTVYAPPSYFAEYDAEKALEANPKEECCGVSDTVCDSEAKPEGDSPSPM